MRRLLMLILCFALFSPCAARTEDKAVDVTYFYFNPCASCNEGQVFASAFYERVKAAGLSGQFRILTSNAYSGRDALDAELARLGLEKSTQLPLLVMGDRHLSGQTAVDERLLDWLQGADPIEETAPVPSTGPGADGPIKSGEWVYLYAPGCRSCAQMKAALQEFPDLNLREINAYDHPEQAAALYDQYAVPEAERLVPMVFLGDQYVSDPEVAATQISAWLTTSGYGAGMG